MAHFHGDALTVDRTDYMGLTDKQNPGRSDYSGKNVAEIYLSGL
jgi:hypothetical protein